MLAPAHIGVAALAGAAVYSDQPILVGITALAGIFPDIDQPSSLIGRGAFFCLLPSACRIRTPQHHPFSPGRSFNHGPLNCGPECRRNGICRRYRLALAYGLRHSFAA